MRLFWKIQNGTEEWSKFFQAKFQNKKGEWISYYKKSSIWPGIKWVIEDVNEDTRWMVGNGDNILVWKDKWIQDGTLKEQFPDNLFITLFPEMKVSDLFLEEEWVIPSEILKMIDINELPVINGGSD
ncbi:uncharacterized protein LOC113342892 [Papaver somniferum]|uniref:uncharacterized protein LOC113342892 n=1 Tax=Papaver somniferum TaxID=3469 RepID=UPI000E6F8D67|nr:uncharacterized protein LOC113342892 [Papaver somniferum]